MDDSEVTNFNHMASLLQKSRNDLIASTYTEPQNNACSQKNMNIDLLPIMKVTFRGLNTLN